MRYSLIALVLSLSQACTSGTDTELLVNTPISEISRTLDQVIPSMAEDYGIQGLAVNVIRSGRVAISKTYGFADLKSKRLINEDTVFRAASFGKPVFAYIVVALSKEGLINLDTPLYDYIKQDVVSDDSRSRLITARMVLNHTTGLPNLGSENKSLDFSFEPGSEFQYSGHGYEYLQDVVEHVTGKRLNELASEMVFNPLQMAHSSFVWQERYRTSLSSSYLKLGEALMIKSNPGLGHAAWSLYTTINDYSRFVSHMIESYATENTVANIMLTASVDVGKDVQWGLGWGLQNTVPNTSFWHWASMAGFRHYVVGYPVEGIAVVVMTNSYKSFKVVDDLMIKAIGGSYPSYDWF